MLSVIIPSFKDPLLFKTIESLLENAEGEIEIIAVLDGYWPDAAMINDERVKYLHIGKNRGMREAINAGVAISRGEYIMRTDEHCVFGKGYDVILTNSLESNWIVTPRRYFLDPVCLTWIMRNFLSRVPKTPESLQVSPGPKGRKREKTL